MLCQCRSHFLTAHEFALLSKLSNQPPELKDGVEMISALAIRQELACDESTHSCSASEQDPLRVTSLSLHYRDTELEFHQPYDYVMI